MNTKHPQVHLQVGDREADVDEELAPLIEALWRRGIDTYMSCQDNQPKGYVWIAFFNSFDADSFLGLFDPPAESELHARIRGEADEWPWMYACFVDDWAATFHYGEEVAPNVAEVASITKEGKSEWGISVSVRFPRLDFDTVCEAVGVCQPASATG